MKKRSIRCYKEYVNLYPNIYNYLVYFPLREGWSSFSFVSCMNCGEIFVIDWENPLTKGMSISETASNSTCPTCGMPLKETIKDYPQNIKMSNGEIGRFSLINYSTSNEESLVLDFFEISPPTTPTVPDENAKSGEGKKD